MPVKIRYFNVLYISFEFICFNRFKQSLGYSHLFDKLLFEAYCWGRDLFDICFSPKVKIGS